MLGLEFGLSAEAISEDLRRVLAALAAGRAYELQWPTPPQIALLFGICAKLSPEFPNWRAQDDVSDRCNCFSLLLVDVELITIVCIWLFLRL